VWREENSREKRLERKKESRNNGIQGAQVKETKKKRRLKSFTQVVVFTSIFAENHVLFAYLHAFILKKVSLDNV
jgi:hypothetical protein